MTRGLKWLGVLACLMQVNDALACYYGIRDGGLIPDNFGWIHAVAAFGWMVVTIQFMRVKCPTT